MTSSLRPGEARRGPGGVCLRVLIPVLPAGLCRVRPEARHGCTGHRRVLALGWRWLTAAGPTPPGARPPPSHVGRDVLRLRARHPRRGLKAAAGFRSEVISGGAVCRGRVVMSAGLGRGRTRAHGRDKPIRRQEAPPRKTDPGTLSPRPTNHVTASGAPRSEGQTHTERPRDHGVGRHGRKGRPQRPGALCLRGPGEAARQPSTLRTARPGCRRNRLLPRRTSEPQPES